MNPSRCVMVATRVAAFVENLQKYHLLDAAQLEAVQRGPLAQGDDPILLDRKSVV